MKEVGDKIYLYPPYLTPEQGKYIEFFPKEVSDTLSQAIQKRFLQGKSEAQCSVEPLDYLRDQYVIKTYEFAEINTHVPQNTGFNAWRQAKEQCSPIYASSQISYFLMNSAHPKKFLFINNKAGSGITSVASTTYATANQSIAGSTHDYVQTAQNGTLEVFTNGDVVLLMPGYGLAFWMNITSAGGNWGVTASWIEF